MQRATPKHLLGLFSWAPPSRTPLV